MTARILLFTGKGGVGKTTSAAATALRCADAGLRTVVLSTDPAHSLADALDAPLGPYTAPVTTNLWGQQLDAQGRMEDSWAEIRDWLREVFRWAGVDALEAEELSVIPGLDEVFALSDIKAHAHAGGWDAIVVDCAPTAETIRLLSLPDVLARYMERLFPVGRTVNRLVSPLLHRVGGLPTADDSVFAATERFYERLAGVRELLTDGQQTSIRLVVNPERLVIAEARRTHTYLSLFGYHVDAVVANRLLPIEVSDPWFAGWRATQADHLATIHDAFAPLPVIQVPLQDAEPVGFEALRRFADVLYDDEDPTARFGHSEPLRVERRDGAMVLEVDLPFADRDEVDLLRRADELLLRVGPYRRAIVLPDSLRRRTVAGARIDRGCLAISFADSAEMAGEADRAEGAAGARTAGSAAPDVADEPRAPEPAAVR